MSALAPAPVLQGQDALEEGKTAFRRGDLALAGARIQSRILADPSDIEARYWLYCVLAAAGDPTAAGRALDDARNLHAVAMIRALGVDMNRFAGDKPYCAQTAVAFYMNRAMTAAGLLFGRALDFERLEMQTLVQYGLALHHQGRSRDAIETFSAAAGFGCPEGHQFLLYALLQDPDRNARLSAEARRWADLYARPPAEDLGPPANPPAEGRRLRIGYVAPNPTRTQIATSMLPVLEAHDPDAVDVTVYCTDPGAEAPLPSHVRVRGLGGLSDEEAARLVRRDGVDVLVDVWGHNAGNRLRMFTYRPAPVQAGWINFMHTTGMSCMDYVLHADSLEVPGTETFFTETIWRTGAIMAPYRTLDARLGPTPTPALANGYVTFASYNHPAKITDGCIAAWSRILQARPGDRLILKYGYFADPVLQRATRARFTAFGADPAQVLFEGHSDGDDYVRSFARVDLALDPSPSPGGTTTMNFIANGVPVLALKGEDFYARTCLPLLLPCGLEELVADTWDDYVRTALDLASDLDRLSRIRAAVRPGFDASPYRDEVGFTRRLERDFRAMFSLWRDAKA